MNLKMPVVKIGNITLREVEPLDYLDYYEIGCDLETVKYLNWGPFNNPNDALWVINEIFLKRPLNGLPVGYAIVMNNKTIGMIDIHTITNDNACEVGYILNRRYWGLGIMRRCLKAIVKVAFEYYNFDKVIVGHTFDNLQSKSVILKCGFKYEYNKMVEMKDELKLGYYYSIYKAEYEGGLI